MNNKTPGLKEFISGYSILKYGHWDCNMSLNSKNSG